MIIRKKPLKLSLHEKSIFVPAVVIGGILGGLILSGLFNNEIQANIKTEELEIGDEFTVNIETENPFEKPLTFGGKIIDKKGDYIQYVDSRFGDTASINIVRNFKYFDVKVKNK